jgi:hypothetical protein
MRFVRSGLDEIDLQHLRDSNHCPSFASRVDMYRYLHDEIVKGTALDYLEFGVYQGESIKYWTSINKAPESRFFGFDSFEGLPEDWRNGQPRGHFHTGGSTPVIEDARVQFVKGWFINSVPNSLALRCASRWMRPTTRTCGRFSRPLRGERGGSAPGRGQRFSHHLHIRAVVQSGSHHHGTARQ